MGFSGDVGIWMSGIWTLFFQRKVVKLLMQHLQSLPEVSIIPVVGKSNLQFFKENRADFSFAVQMQTFQFKTLHYEKDIESFATRF